MSFRTSPRYHPWLSSSEAFEDKSFFSGGCCVEDESPAYHCNSCGHDFGKQTLGFLDITEKTP